MTDAMVTVSFSRPTDRLRRNVLEFLKTHHKDHWQLVENSSGSIMVRVASWMLPDFYAAAREHPAD